jgi:hypothetical protein
VAGSVVAVAWRRIGLAAVAIGLLLSGVSACSSFDPVKERRYKLLRQSNDPDLDMVGAHWHVYDDQHSLKSACTNAAGGNHESWQCSTLTEPRFTWDGGVCPPTTGNLKRGELPASDPLAGSDEPICLHGVIGEVLDCNTGTHPIKCYNAENAGDVSNMWGAGIGLRFSEGGQAAWSPTGHRIGAIRGVAFDVIDLLALDGASDLNLRIEFPIALEGDTRVPFTKRPLMRDDGRVIGTDGILYGDCEEEEPRLFPPLNKEPLESVVLSDLVAPSDAVTSNQHPYGHPFWQLPQLEPDQKREWKPSPWKRGHNELVWKEVKAPPETKADGNYDFPRYVDSDPDIELTQDDLSHYDLLGIEFHVVPPASNNRDSIAFGFCIQNLAFLLEE